MEQHLVVDGEVEDRVFQLIAEPWNPPVEHVYERSDVRHVLVHFEDVAARGTKG
jgi:hypothetical protein